MSKVNGKVALIVGVCNDLSPNTLIQTANQTYKNLDVWILDDSTKPDVITQIQNFANDHGYHVCRRPSEHRLAHPSFIGNIFYFLDKHANEYEYMLETNSSTVMTNTFVENSLKFMNTAAYDSSQIAAVCSNGSFYPSKNLFSFLNSRAKQWENANCTGGGYRMVGSQMCVDGWAALYRMSYLTKFPLDQIECPGCDTARSFYMAQHGIKTMFNPFDFSGKLATQNIYRFKKQRTKWASADAFIVKHYFAKRSPYWKVNFYINIQYLASTFLYITGITFGLSSVILSLACDQLTFVNMTGMFLTGLCFVPFVVLFVVASLINKANALPLIFTILGTLFDVSILFKKFYMLVIYGLMQGKWSSKAVTVKTSEKLTFKQWWRICWGDILWLIICITVCLCVTLLTKVNPFLIWTTLFFFVAGPSILWIIASFISYIPIKNGWDDQMKEFDIARSDFRFKYVKESEIWKKQHPDIQ